MIVTCGEALVDLIPETVDGDIVYRPVLGGSLFLVALGIARLGGSSGYLWDLSTDQLGERFAHALRTAQVDCSGVRFCERATPVALVDTSGPEPRYSIADPDGVMLDTVPLPLPPGTTCLHIGSAVLAREPVAAAIEAVARKARLVTIDINARAPSIVDPEAYRARLRRIGQFSGIVKASQADIAMIGENDAEGFMARLVESGTAMAVLTAAEAGACAITRDARVWVASAAKRVVDPVGAGDAFMAALLTKLQLDGALCAQTLGAMDAAALRNILVHAQTAAAFTCGQKGAVMPSSHDLAA